MISLKLPGHKKVKVTLNSEPKDVQSLHATIHTLQEQIAAKDSLIKAMRHNIKEKKEFISYLIDELRAFKKEETKHWK